MFSVVFFGCLFKSVYDASGVSMICSAVLWFGTLWIGELLGTWSGYSCGVYYEFGVKDWIVKDWMDLYLGL